MGATPRRDAVSVLDHANRACSIGIASPAPNGAVVRNEGRYERLMTLSRDATVMNPELGLSEVASLHFTQAINGIDRA